MLLRRFKLPAHRNLSESEGVENLLGRTEAARFTTSCVEQTLDLGDFGVGDIEKLVSIGKKSRMSRWCFHSIPALTRDTAKKILAVKA
jgi:hypothetical protein